MTKTGSLTGDEVCTECGGTNLVEDYKQGDMTCSDCGAINSERLVSMEAEYRVMNEDSGSQSKIRVGKAYNILQEHTLTEKTKLERDEKEFLWDGMKDIDEVLVRMYNGEISNLPVKLRAEELFQDAFRVQVQQKKGLLDMKRNNSKKKNPRQRFSKRKQYVVACLSEALKENRIDAFKDEDITARLGVSISKNSIKTCIKELTEAKSLVRTAQQAQAQQAGDVKN